MQNFAEINNKRPAYTFKQQVSTTAMTSILIPKEISEAETSLFRRENKRKISKFSK